MQPLLSELGKTEVDYLKAVSSELGQDRLASTADISQRLGKTAQQLSKTRARLIDLGYIASPAHGRLMICVPYPADYVKRESDAPSAPEVMRLRRV